MQRKFNYKYNEDYKSNVASLQFTILSDGNSSDISITVFWDVASSRFTEWGKSTKQTINQTRRRLLPLDRQQFQSSSVSLYMSRNFYWDICWTTAVCFLYYKPEKFLYNKFLLQVEWDEVMQLEIELRREQTRRVSDLQQDFRHIVSAIKT
jgi:hypothetical protein